MRRLTRTAAGLAAAVAVAGLLLVTHEATATTVDGTRTAVAASRTVTLLTGDRVTALEGDDDMVSVEPGTGGKASPSRPGGSGGISVSSRATRPTCWAPAGSIPGCST